MRNTIKKILEYGDFQSPSSLVDQACLLLKELGVVPASLVEPTCGIGNFFLSALERFPSAKYAVGLEINSDYVENLSLFLKGKKFAAKSRLLCCDFFSIPWEEIVEDLPRPLLVIGNPPWVTSDQLGRRNQTNLPPKSNFKNLTGLSALTGKGNFDISEWMLLRIFNKLKEGDVMAMICKTTVARRVLDQAWKENAIGFKFSLYRVNAKKYFGVSVDTCFFICRRIRNAVRFECAVFEKFDKIKPDHIIGYRGGTLVADSTLYDRWQHLEIFGQRLWRSGIKHDCSRVMELRRVDNRFRNGFGDSVDLESDFLYPMLKSSDLVNGSVEDPDRVMIVTQTKIGGDTAPIREKAPKTWAYLQRYGSLLDKRRSFIYRKRPRFSVFGVGEYSFSLWKVAISGFYTNLRFRCVGPARSKPIALDDTTYFIPCESETHAKRLYEGLNSKPAEEFFRALIFSDSKRPVTAELLNRLNLSLLTEASVRMKRE